MEENLDKTDLPISPEDNFESNSSREDSSSNNVSAGLGLIGEKIERTQQEMEVLRQSLSDVRERIGIDKQRGDGAVIDLEERLSKLKSEQINNLRQVSEDPEFQRLLPGFIEHMEQRVEIKKPLIHGTGSYALRRVIKEGFVPRSGGGVGVGESTYYKSEKFKDEPNPVSFAVADKYGEKIAHLYATLCSYDTELSLDSEKILGDKKFDRTINDIYGSWESLVDSRMAIMDMSGLTEEQIKKVREYLEKNLQHRYLERSRKAANIFDPNFTEQRIATCRRALSSDVSDEEAEGIFRDLDLLDSWMQYHKRPLFETKASVLEMKKEAVDEGSYLYGQIQRLIQSGEKAIQAYHALSWDEQRELSEQFPCVIVLEGEGGEFIDSDWMKPPIKEVQSKKITPASRIREIQVPEGKIPEVKKWLEEAGLSVVSVVPIEFFEMKEVIEHKQ